MIKQKYDFKFFYDNYKYRYYTMFENYYKKLEKYRYFISIYDNLDRREPKVYRSNLELQNILDKLKSMDGVICADITDNRFNYPNPKKYEYYNINNKQFTTSVIFCNLYNMVARQNYNTKEFYFKIWRDTQKGKVRSCRIDNESIFIFIDGITIDKHYNKKEVECEKTIPLSSAIPIEYSYKITEVVKRIRDKIKKDSFYSDMVEILERELL